MLETEVASLALNISEVLFVSFVSWCLGFMFEGKQTKVNSEFLFEWTNGLRLHGHSVAPDAANLLKCKVYGADKELFVITGYSIYHMFMSLNKALNLRFFIALTYIFSFQF